MKRSEKLDCHEDPEGKNNQNTSSSIRRGKSDNDRKSAALRAKNIIKVIRT